MNSSARGKNLSIGCASLAQASVASQEQASIVYMFTTNCLMSCMILPPEYPLLRCRLASGGARLRSPAG